MRLESFERSALVRELDDPTIVTDIVGCKRDDTTVETLSGTLDCVRLSCSCLPIGQDAAIVSVQRCMHDGANNRGVNVMLGGRISKDAIKYKCILNSRARRTFTLGRSRMMTVEGRH
jgi:hypothetical protein